MIIDTNEYFFQESITVYIKNKSTMDEFLTQIIYLEAFSFGE